MDTRPVVLSGYAAKTCARAIHNSYDVTVERPPDEGVSEELQRRFDAGIVHEQHVFDLWLSRGVRAVDLREFDSHETKDEHIAATIEAMQQRKLVILGGRLPDDEIGGRTGKPDVLLLDRDRDASGYHPADVKWHLVLDKKKTGGLVADFRQPRLGAAQQLEDVGLRHDVRDLLQLAHYWRMLTACGFAAREPWGAIIGTDDLENPKLAWYDLTQKIFTTYSRSLGKTSRSTLERYDHEHDFRVKVARNAQRRHGDPQDPAPLVEPIGQEECSECIWAPVCVDLLPSDDLSRELRKALSVREYLALREQGVATVGDLANANIEEVLESTYADETSHQRSRAQRLYQAHMSAQLALDGVVLRLKPDAVFDVPSAAVEIDMDMESTREGLVYLWGVLITSGGVSTYRGFGDRSVSTAADENALARQCFDWLVATHPDAKVFHYSHVEKSIATRILGDDLDRYAGTVADPASWIDLLPPTRACLDSRDGHSLKVVAVHGAGFEWRDDDPGGLQSQAWLEAARDGDDEAWQRVLDYNEDDVRATLAVRSFLRTATTS